MSNFSSCVLQVFDILMSSSDLTEKVAANTKLFRSRMQEAGFSLTVSYVSSTTGLTANSIPTAKQETRGILVSTIYNGFALQFALVCEMDTSALQSRHLLASFVMRSRRLGDHD